MTDPGHLSPGPGPGQGVIYTCPMHPPIRQEGPGACPVFGWTLSPVVAAAAMALSSVSVIANALRLRMVRL